MLSDAGRSYGNDCGPLVTSIEQLAGAKKKLIS